MGILLRKRFEKYHFSLINRLAIMGFLVSLALSFSDTIWALYIDSFVNNASYVGFISGGLTLVSLISYFLIIPYIEKYRKDRIYLFTLLLYAVGYFLFAFNKSFYLFIIIAFVLSVGQTFRITSYGLMIKDKSKGESLVKNEGLIYTFLNLAWLIGPLVAGFAAEKMGLNFVFILAGVFMIISIFFFKFVKVIDAHVEKTVHTNLFKNFLDFFKSKQRIIVYFISGGVNFWWVLIYLFGPLYIVRHGLSNVWVGYFLFAIALPLILTEYKFSKFVEKVGFKKMFCLGYLIVAILSFICFFVGNVYVVLGLLVLASFGMAMIEPTSEAYFFRVVNKKGMGRFYAPYNTTMDVNNFIGKIVSSVVLLFLPFNYVFVVFGFAMVVFFLLSFNVKNIK